MMLSANDDDAMASIVIGNNMDEMKNWFNTYFLPYIKVAKVCYGTKGCFPNKVKNSNGSILYSSGQCRAATISFVLNNGSYICMDDYGTSHYGVYFGGISITLLVDVNGDKEPNQLGKDIFAMVFKDNQLVPGGYDMTDEQIAKNCSESCTGNECGSYCMQKVVKNGYKLPVYGK